MFFHTMHVAGVNELLPKLLGIDYRQIAELRGQRLSWYEIAARHDVPAAQVRRRFVTMLTSSAREGIAEQQTLPAQEASSLSFQLSNLRTWLSFKPAVIHAGVSFSVAEQSVFECHRIAGDVTASWRSIDRARG